jgi:hypothetical protein
LRLAIVHSGDEQASIAEWRKAELPALQVYHRSHSVPKQSRFAALGEQLTGCLPGLRLNHAFQHPESIVETPRHHGCGAGVEGRPACLSNVLLLLLVHEGRRSLLN